MKNNIQKKDWTPAESLQRQVDYYDARSSSYSNERYPKVTSNYMHYVFKTRQKIFLDFLRGIINNLPENPSILEIGCADGLMFREIEKEFPNVFSKMVGVDVSPKMIEEANRQNKNTRSSFLLRENLAQEKFDVIIELGVYPFDMGEEMSIVKNSLKDNGYFFYSVSGSGSFYTNIKNKDAYHLKFHKTYKNYHKFFSNYFSVKKSQVYGMFIPKLWSIPPLARVLQPIFDFVFKIITPELFHEKIYLLQNNTNAPKV